MCKPEGCRHFTKPGKVIYIKSDSAYYPPIGDSLQAYDKTDNHSGPTPSERMVQHMHDHLMRSIDPRSESIEVYLIPSPYILSTTKNRSIRTYNHEWIN